MSTLTTDLTSLLVADPFMSERFGSWDDAIKAALTHPMAIQNIEALERKLLDLEQVPCPVIHRFGPGLYIREVAMPAGTFAVGHFQRFEHMNVMLKGRVTVLNEKGGTTELVAPMIFVGKPGQKVGYIHEDMVWQNIYATDETDVETLEATFLVRSTTLDEDLTRRRQRIPLEVERDRIDYRMVLAEFGIPHEQAHAETEFQGDRISFPFGDYKVAVSDSLIDGKGLFATAEIAPGEVIAPARVAGKRTPAGRYTNHSATPNARFVQKPNGDLDLVATEDIHGMQGGRLGQEITIDYRQALTMRKQLCQQQ